MPDDIAIFLIFGIVIGTIVSIDVTGLTISQYLDYTNKKKVTDKRSSDARFMAHWAFPPVHI